MNWEVVEKMANLDEMERTEHLEKTGRRGIKVNKDLQELKDKKGIKAIKEWTEIPANKVKYAFIDIYVLDEH